MEICDGFRGAYSMPLTDSSYLREHRIIIIVDFTLDLGEVARDYLSKSGERH